MLSTPRVHPRVCATLSPHSACIQVGILISVAVALTVVLSPSPSPDNTLPNARRDTHHACMLRHQHHAFSHHQHNAGAP